MGRSLDRTFYQSSDPIEGGRWVSHETGLYTITEMIAAIDHKIKFSMHSVGWCLILARKRNPSNDWVCLFVAVFIEKGGSQWQRLYITKMGNYVI